MKYLMLIAEADHFANWDRADQSQRDRIAADFTAFTSATRAKGTIVATEALDHPNTAWTVRPGPDRRVTDGPFAETVEQLGGFYLVDVPDEQTAIELAALLPDEYAVEVRPVLHVEM